MSPYSVRVAALRSRIARPIGGSIDAVGPSRTEYQKIMPAWMWSAMWLWKGAAPKTQEDRRGVVW